MGKRVYSEKNERYRKIPSVDRILGDALVQELIREYGRRTVTDAIRSVLDEVRERLSDAAQDQEILCSVEEIAEMARQRIADLTALSMKRVINGTGTILHTGLGRAPVGASVLEQTVRIGGGYSNLEYDLDTDRRGDRSSHFERLLCRITGAGAALAVNNNAAAVLLLLSAVASGGEVIVSRGELVEIGGKFRIPDVMELSGAALREVGTTNRTRREDYESAVGESTKLLLKVHTSNYRIVGFTESVSVAELSEIGERSGIPVAVDLGSGVLIDLERYGLPHEPTVREVLEQGANLVCFSGDKLLGGPQAGIIVGSREYIDRIRRHPLIRPLRMDKMTAAALEAVLVEYLNPEQAVQTIPALRMLTEKVETTRSRAARFLALAGQKGCSARAEMSGEACCSQTGGGALPETEIPSAGITVRPYRMSASALEQRLRHTSVPVVARVLQDKVLIDLRTVADEEVELLSEMLLEALS